MHGTNSELFVRCGEKKIHSDGGGFGSKNGKDFVMAHKMLSVEVRVLR
jgi:hypothetical protein